MEDFLEPHVEETDERDEAERVDEQPEQVHDVGGVTDGRSQAGLPGRYWSDTGDVAVYRRVAQT